MRYLPNATIRARGSRPRPDSIGGRTAFLLLAIVATSLAMATDTHAQSVPVQTASPLYTPFSMPKVNGTLQYSLTGSQSETFGYNGGNATNVNGSISGNLGFSAPSVRRPFSIGYSGGLSFNSQGQSSPFFQNLSLSQGFNSERWKFNLNDSISFLPQTPTVGLSGIPGVGDLGVSTGTDASQQVITPNSDRISNSASASLSRDLTGKTTLSTNGSYSVQRFLNDPNAIETNSVAAGSSLSRRLDARSSTSASYHYSQYSYVGDPGAFASQGATFNYTRQLTRKLNLSAGAGPEFIGGSASTGRNAEYTYNADVRLSYMGGVASAASLTAAYVRSTNSGYGTNLGAVTDNYSVSGTRRVTRSLQPSAQISFTRTMGLASAGSPALITDTFVASVQANRALSRVVSAYGSYSVEHQTYAGSFQGVSPITGVIQTLAFGVTYSPSSVHVGRQ